MKKLRRAFTLLELVIVIVILGIVAKFGVELLIRAYDYYIQSLAEHRYQAQSEIAVEQVANRLQQRLPGSEIVRQGAGAAFTPLALTTDDTTATITVLEWIGLDADGLRGDGGSRLPTWSGFIDVDPTVNPANANNKLVTPGTDLTRVTNVFNALSPDGSFNNGDAALFFMQDSNFNVITGFGWDGTGATALAGQTRTAHPVLLNAADNNFTAAVGNFSLQKIYEFYKLSWTAYALEHNTTNHQLRLYYDYRPWNGQSYTSGSSVVLMENVDTFRYLSIGDAIKVQVCIRDTNLFTETDKRFSICKEKTVF